MWRARLVRAELDPLRHQLLLELVSEELAPAVGLDSLNRKWHFFEDFFEEKQRVGRCCARVKGQHSDASAIIDGGILIQPWRDLAGIHLHSITRHIALVAMPLLTRKAALFERRLCMGLEDFVHGGARQSAVVLALQLTLNAARPQSALAEVENPLLLLGEDLLGGRLLWSFTLALKTN